MKRYRCAGFSVLLLAGCGSTATSSPTPAQDILAEKACGQYRQLTIDSSKGILTNAEVRDRLKAIYSSGKYADDQVIATQSASMLATDTQNDSAGFKSALNLFDAECTKLGF